MYANKYDKQAIIAAAADEKTKRILIPIGVYAIADKYDVSKIYAPAAEDVYDVLKTTNDAEFELLQVAIDAHYGAGANIDSAMGKLIASVVLSARVAFTETADFERIMQSHPMFGADIALALRRADHRRFENISAYSCASCFRNLWINKDEMRKTGLNHFKCIYCGRTASVSVLRL